jgi:hypothetical protein
MKDFINKLISSLDVHTKDSFSARKLTAFAVMLCVIAAHVKWLSLGDFAMLGEILLIDYAFVAALLGMTTYQSIKSLKGSDKE